MLYILYFSEDLLLLCLRPLCVYFRPVSGVDTTKIECLKSQVERVSFQHGMAELVKAPIPGRIRKNTKTVLYTFEPRLRQTLI